ncbi:helix-turn-helix domain-containing protein [Wenzhouxiangella sp. AB-CW3]|uniref:helix-turn-helix domain-containing protein n=1 Tax=Wenzhouxiangella sp. AB-CW3 TaxID=2771012 RepID=UPI001CC3022D|nr:helix-turn-helix transcriptional regulator [Wenzhouxiangella sp. AB-CW3]
MPSITYSLLDEQMTQDDKVFFKQLGKRVAGLRKELGLTQIQLAEQLGISQQLIAAYEAGARKIPASMLPTLAKLFAVSLEELVGMEKQPAKRGPASILQRQIEQIGQMPRAKQKFITEMLEALIRQQKAS